jgi:FlaA1/EpsC-like NDP-sugar epimerase
MYRMNQRRLAIIHDLIMIVMAWFLSWMARFNFDIQEINDWNRMVWTLPLILIVQGIVSKWFGFYRGLWRFASLPDLWNIFRASLLGAVIITILLFYINRLDGIPRSILILYPVFLIFLLGAPRLGYRLWKDHKLSINTIIDNKRVLIIGAGHGAEMLIREIMRVGNYMPVAILDDNASLKGSEIHGVKIYGGIKRAQEFIDRFDIDMIFIAIPSATSNQMQVIMNVCEKTNLPVRTLPGIQDMVGSSDALSKLREVSIEDLLGREKVKLDWQKIEEGITNKIVLVTGGGGSIGSELCMQIASLEPSALIIIERCEFNLYKIEKDILSVYPKLKLHSILGDLCDSEKLEHVLDRYKPNLIFHAAAYKHVPILEREVREAIRNNIIGTKNIADLANKHKCNRFILISTDKAVNPTNVLGVTKRIAEMYIENMNNVCNTSYITVRFGNVLGSDGSVVPLFKEQINNGGPITVTHPEITRYFMTIPEASQLILQAGAMGEGGEIFVLDMGMPVKISYLAEQMIRLSGLIPDEDIKIQYTGLRPGEKMYEELFYENEIKEKTKHSKILLAKHRVIDLKEYEHKINNIISSINDFDNEKLKLMLNELVPMN